VERLEVVDVQDQQTEAEIETAEEGRISQVARGDERRPGTTLELAARGGQFPSGGHQIGDSAHGNDSFGLGTGFWEPTGFARAAAEQRAHERRDLYDAVDTKERDEQKPAPALRAVPMVGPFVGRRSPAAWD